MSSSEPPPEYKPTSDVFRDEVVCTRCGGLVVDRDTHTKYHRQNDRKARP